MDIPGDSRRERFVGKPVNFGFSVIWCLIVSQHFALRREQSTPQTRILSLIHFFPAHLC
jgi:hypothetical protein